MFFLTVSCDSCLCVYGCSDVLQVLLNFDFFLFKMLFLLSPFHVQVAECAQHVLQAIQ